MKLDIPFEDKFAAGLMGSFALVWGLTFSLLIVFTGQRQSKDQSDGADNLSVLQRDHGHAYKPLPILPSAKSKPGEPSRFRAVPSSE